MAIAEPLAGFERDLPAVLDHAAVEQARLVRAARAALLEQGSLSYRLLAEGRGTTPGAARKWASRHGGRLITVTQDGTVLIPTFQLDEALDLRDDIAVVTLRLHAFGLDGWGAWDWWTVANGWLDGASPRDAAERGDHDGVERAARGLVGA